MSPFCDIFQSVMVSGWTLDKPESIMIGFFIMIAWGMTKMLAFRWFGRALIAIGGLAEAHNNLAIALTMQGKMHDAIRHFRTALHLRPGYIEAKKNLTLALRGVKRKSSDYQ